MKKKRSYKLNSYAMAHSSHNGMTRREVVMGMVLVAIFTVLTVAVWLAAKN